MTFALIALATTATTATFAVVRATLWRALPYADDGALTNIYTTEPANRDSTQQMASSAMLLARWREHTRTLVGVEGVSPISISVVGDGEPEALSGAAVSAGMFELLGTPPAVGRSFRREDEAPASGVIVISDAVARRRFGNPNAALGKILSVDGDPRTVIGVMSPGFSLLFQGGDAWIPLDLTLDQQTKVNLRNIASYGRLRAGNSVEQARAELEAIRLDIAAGVPTYARNTRRRAADVSAIQSRFVLNETMQSLIDVDGVAVAPGQRLFSQIRHVMPNVFRVLGVRVMAGRGLDSTDRADTRFVAVISASFAKAHWPGESAVGKRVRRGAPGSPWLEVVGVVEDVTDAGLGVPLGPTLYVPYLQQNTATARVTLVARVRASTSTLIDGVRRAVWAVSSTQAIDGVTPLRR